MVKHDHFGLKVKRQNDGQVPSSGETGMWRKLGLHQLHFIAFELFKVFAAPLNNKTLNSCTLKPYSLATHNSPHWESAPGNGSQPWPDPLYLSAPLPPVYTVQLIFLKFYILPQLQALSQKSLYQGGLGWVLPLMTAVIFPTLTS